MSEECYTLGYGPASVALMALRTADAYAKFFLDALEPGMRILDVGCGPGTITIGLAEAVNPGEVVGAELNLSQTESVQAQARDKGLNLHFESASVYALPHPDESFDAVFMSALIGNLKKPRDGLREVLRVLRKGGFVGIREFDHSANIGFPDTVFESRVAELHNRLRIRNGHDPDSGRKVRGLLNGAGFERVDARATFDTSPPAEQVVGSPIMASLLKHEWGPRFVELGWAAQSEVDSWVEQFRSYRRGPEHFSAQAWIEAVGYRPVDCRQADA